MADFSREEKDEFEFMYRYIDTIASGAFGTVIKALDLHNQREVAVKIISKETHDKALLKQIEQEVEILAKLDHEHIVKFETFIETKKKMYIVMEYCSGGSLKTYIEKYKNTLTEDQAKIIINSLLSAVNYLHQRDICHRDIKPENIMFSEEDNIDTIKLVDFGLSAQYFEHKEEFENCGTLLYMAPEQIHNKTYSKGIDIWSVGIILFKLLNENRHPLWTKEGQKKSYLKKLKEQPIQLFSLCSELAKSVLMKLLERNPSFRYTAQNALDHPWISGRKNAPIPETVFDKLKKEAMKKKLLIFFNVSLFIMHFNNFKSKINKDWYNNRFKVSNSFKATHKEKETIFSLKKDPIAMERPISQNSNCKNAYLLFKLSKKSKRKFISKEMIQSKKTKTVIDNKTNPNHFEQKKLDLKLESQQDTNDIHQGYLFYQHRSSKQVYNGNFARNSNISKKYTFNKNGKTRFNSSPSKYNKQPTNPLIKYKIPHKNATDTQCNIKHTGTQSPLLLPKIST